MDNSGEQKKLELHIKLLLDENKEHEKSIKKNLPIIKDLKSRLRLLKPIKRKKC